MIAAAKKEVAERLLAAPRPTGEASWAAKARAAAEDRLTVMGGPVRRDEYWKYTDPARLLAGGATDGAHAPLDGLDAVTAEIGGPAPALEGVEALMLKAALAVDLGFGRDLFGVLEAAGHEKVARPLAALNTARATEGFALRVTGAAPKPLHVVNGPAMAHHVVRVETGGSLTIVETGLAANTVMEIDLAPGARLDHVRVQQGAMAPGATHVFARVAAGADLRSFTLSADGTLTRNEVVVDMQGDDARAHVGGAVLANGDSHIDNTVFVTHGALRGESRQVFKNVIDGRGRAVFQGKIFVRKDAQKTDGYQISQSILLSPTAEFDVKPELEIYADDVKCSHGSTTGAMDADAMFYLQARGVPRREAEALMVAAFVDEAVAEIADEGLADLIRGRVAAWMASR
jgi:Fe-S cluster assembly protein SufD